VEPQLAGTADLLDRAVADGIPAASAWVLHQGRCIHASAHGGSDDGPTNEDSLFDVASLTKALATTSVAAVLTARGVLHLDAPVASLLEDCTLPQGVTPRHLLAHTSGLDPWRPLFVSLESHPVAGDLFKSPHPGAWALARRIIYEQARTGTPTPGTCQYSDLGFLVLGEILETLGGESLDALAQRLVFDPLAMKDTGFVRLPIGEEGTAFRERHVLPTGQHRPRNPAPGQEGMFQSGTGRSSVVGEVDDDNAWAMGGVAPHAGLFSTARDVARWGACLAAETQGSAGIGAPRILEEWMEDAGTGRGLGFDRPGGVGSTAGTRWGQGPLGGFGHLGFTGCSIWVDRDREISAALLTNRVWPGREHLSGIQALRPAFHESVLDSL
jgi:CubicO group peptidase (beta-lactamase class C family)